MDKPEKKQAKENYGWGYLIFAIVMFVILFFISDEFQGKVNSWWDRLPFNKRETERQTVEEIKKKLEQENADSNFSAIKNQTVRVGMTKAEVVRSIGSNYKKERVTDSTLRQHAEEQWIYERPSISIVTFDWEGRVLSCSANIKYKNISELAAMNVSAGQMNKVRIGMTKAEVIKSMGAPDRKEQSDAFQNAVPERWIYTKGYVSAATVVFGSNNLVSSCSDNIRYEEQ